MKRNLNILLDSFKHPKLSSIGKNTNIIKFRNNERVNFTTRIPVTPPRLEQQFWKDINEKQFHDWTREHVATLLILDEEHGGCNLSLKDAEEFWRIKFDGKMLEKIAKYLYIRNEIDVGVSVVTRQCDIDKDVVIKVVKWLQYLLKNKFYYLWDESQINNYCKTNNIDNDINLIKKHSKFNETTINPNFFYNNWELYTDDLNIECLNYLNELDISYLKSLVNIDHLNNNINSSNSDLVKNRVTINGSEFKLKRKTGKFYWSNYHVYSVLSPKGSETQNFLSNMASKYPSIIITGNSKDEILLIEHILSTFQLKDLDGGRLGPFDVPT